MTRGTFGNIRIRNQLAPGTEGGYTTYLGPTEPRTGPFPWLHYESRRRSQANGECRFIYDAAVKYQKHASRSWSSPAVTTAWARAVTGPPRARTCSGFGP